MMRLSSRVRLSGCRGVAECWFAVCMDFVPWACGGRQGQIEAGVGDACPATCVTARPDRGVRVAEELRVLRPDGLHVGEDLTQMASQGLVSPLRIVLFELIHHGGVLADQ